MKNRRKGNIFGMHNSYQRTFSRTHVDRSVFPISNPEVLIYKGAEAAPTLTALAEWLLDVCDYGTLMLATIYSTVGQLVRVGVEHSLTIDELELSMKLDLSRNCFLFFSWRLIGESRFWIVSCQQWWFCLLTDRIDVHKDASRRVFSREHVLVKL